MNHAPLCTGNNSYSCEVSFAVVILVRSCNCFFSLEGNVGQKQINSRCFEVSCCFPISLYAHDYSYLC